MTSLWFNLVQYETLFALATSKSMNPKQQVTCLTAFHYEYVIANTVHTVTCYESAFFNDWLFIALCSIVYVSYILLVRICIAWPTQRHSRFQRGINYKLRIVFKIETLISLVICALKGWMYLSEHSRPGIAVHKQR